MARKQTAQNVGAFVCVNLQDVYPVQSAFLLRFIYICSLYLFTSEICVKSTHLREFHRQTYDISPVAKHVFGSMQIKNRFLPVKSRPRRIFSNAKPNRSQIPQQQIDAQ